MAKPSYPWKRFWCKRNGQINLGDDGFLVDPDSEYGHELNCDVFGWESISETPCLVLLGEPGIGKSTAMDGEYQRRQTDGRSSDDFLWVDLRAYQTDQRLHDDVFVSDQMRSWLAGANRLHIFFDSMDEALIRIDNIGFVLLNELRKLPVSRLIVRLACRTAEWPAALEDGLNRLWNDQAAIYELAPLRRVDVLLAAKDRTSDSSSFLNEITSRNVVPLAIKPVTLNFLLNRYAAHGELPKSQVELYEDGCQRLCQEDAARIPATADRLSPGNLMSIAARIAAGTTLCNRYAIWTAPDDGDVPTEDLTLADLDGGSAVENGTRIPVTQTALRQVLATGLFSSRGPGRMGWAHQSYAEFLAAQFIAQQGFSVDGALSLILHEDGKVVPQLHGVAAWLVMMIPALLERLIAADAGFLLYSSVAVEFEADRKNLVDALLRLFEKRDLLDSEWFNRPIYSRLAHSGLAEQLFPYLLDGSREFVARRAAIRFAELCEVQAVLPELVKISLNPAEVYEIRVSAAHAVSQFGDANSKKQLRLLALGQAGADPRDDLRGIGLIATWPQFLSAEELFDALTPNHRSNYFGSYRSFLSRDIAGTLSQEDLIPALDWAADRSGVADRLNPLWEIADAIAARALEHIDSPAICERLARLVASWSASARHVQSPQESQFQSKLILNPGSRRRLLLQVLPLVGVDPSWFLHQRRGGLLQREDLGLVIGLFNNPDFSGCHAALTLIVRWLYDIDDPNHTDAVLGASGGSTVLASEFAWLLHPIELGSTEADEQRKQWQDSMKFSHRPKPDLGPTPSQRITESLRRFDSGDLHAFWLIIQDLRFEPTSEREGGWPDESVTRLPGWIASDEEKRAQIVEAAKKYVSQFEPQPRAEWLETSTYQLATLAGYCAFELLLSQAARFLEDLPDERWRTWAPIVVAAPFLSADAMGEAQRLIKLAHERVPTAVLDTIDLLIDKENQRYGASLGLERFDLIWDEKLVTRLLVKVGDAELQPGAFGSLLAALIQRGSDTAIRVAGEALSSPIPSSTDAAGRHRAIAAAQVLIRNLPGSWWNAVWPAVLNDEAFGLEIFKGIASGIDDRKSGVIRRLTDCELGNLYEWLVQCVPYPVGTVDRSDGFGFVTPEMSLQYWRDGVLNLLTNRGTPEACNAIRRVMLDSPALTWLKWNLLEAEKLTRRATWLPLDPRSLISLAANHDRRVVQNGYQLLEVLIESLDRLQKKLQGESPAASDLWNEPVSARRNATPYTPKDEGRISEYVKRHFESDIRDRGIVVNREVQIRTGTGNKPGERTDIHVAAVMSRSDEKFDQVSAIVEVKGCWNRDLATAMKEQLADRYLNDNPCPFGIYLVGWFRCPQWDSSDPRQNHTSRRPFDEVRAFFEDQAHALTSGAREVRAFVLDATLR